MKSVGGRETGENNEEERARETAPATQRAFQTADDGVKGPFHHKKLCHACSMKHGMKIDSLFFHAVAPITQNRNATTLEC